MSYPHHVPRLALDPTGGAVVLRHGMVAGLSLLPGDRLLLGPPSSVGTILLVPRGRGRPMLGHIVGGGLVAEPGCVPCSVRRWSVAGVVTRVERRLEHHVRVPGTQWMELRIDGARAPRELLTSGWCDPSVLVNRCHRLARWARRSGAVVRVAVSPDPGRARLAVHQVRVGCVGIDMVGPGRPEGYTPPVSVAVPPVEEATPRMQLSLFGDSPGT
jgi:hypothetical protein